MTIRTTISLDEELYAKLKQFTKPRGINQFVNEAVREKCQQVERETIENLMKAGYLATKSDRASLNEDWQTVDGEGWPE